ncbi:MAG: acylphosphatase [Gammaproteobacteria bacterium]|jgi:acylphosphatase|nr:acylphosphatase [Gammaproteobacteria bacterium]HJP37146.1 acylphosphatase [Gammaproteobacteria bacterium]
MSAIAKHYRILGRVQGVFYRGSARAEALALGLVGWVRNLADGSVEVYACGEAEAIGQFEAWLKTGPRQAKVTEVVVNTAPVETLSEFEVR